MHRLVETNIYWIGQIIWNKISKIKLDFLIYCGYNKYIAENTEVQDGFRAQDFFTHTKNKNKN